MDFQSDTLCYAPSDFEEPTSYEINLHEESIVNEDYSCASIYEEEPTDQNYISPEDRFIGHLDETKIRDSFYLSIVSTLARSPKAESELAPYGKKIVEYLEQFGDANCLKLEREINVKFFGKAAAIRHAEERLFERLKPSLQEFDSEPAIRSKTSWRAEVAAIILASYGKASSIPKQVQREINELFSDNVLKQAKKFKARITQNEALQWLENPSIRRSVCKYADLSCESVFQLASQNT